MFLVWLLLDLIIIWPNKNIYLTIDVHMFLLQYLERRECEYDSKTLVEFYTVRKLLLLLLSFSNF